MLFLYLTVASSAHASSRASSRASCSSRASSVSEGDLSEASDGPNATTTTTTTTTTTPGAKLWFKRPLTILPTRFKPGHSTTAAGSSWSRTQRVTARSPAWSEGEPDGQRSQVVLPPTTPDTISDSDSHRSSRISRNLPTTPSLSTDTLNDGAVPITPTIRTDSIYRSHRVLPTTPGTSREGPQSTSRLPRPVTPGSERGASSLTPRQPQFKAPTRIPTRTATTSRPVSRPDPSSDAH